MEWSCDPVEARLVHCMQVYLSTLALMLHERLCVRGISSNIDKDNTKGDDD